MAPSNRSRAWAVASSIWRGSISSNIAKEIFPEIFATGKMPAVMVEEKDLKQTSDTGELEAICSQVMTDHPKAVDEFKGGKENAIKWFQHTCKLYPKNSRASQAHAHLQNKYKISVTLGGANEKD